MPNLGLEPKADIEALLEHTRSLFQYHAGQRHDSIRNFFIAFGLFLAVDVTAHTSNNSYADYIRLILDTTILILTLIFWGLDYRNSQMVEIDEKALKEIEKEVSDTYALLSFNLSESWEQKTQFRRYGNLMKITFGYFCVLFSLILVWDIYELIV
jgi:hypothetical protein